ncbi:MAG: hypothetical protein KBB71_13645, partial [Lentimicrobiaceae bacterium]|nr:hypothetical protein [Lentimicrobiaceae bacterium]
GNPKGMWDPCGGFTGTHRVEDERDTFLKFQIPKTKFQTNHRIQITKAGLDPGSWDLFGFWTLEFGICSTTR